MTCQPLANEYERTLLTTLRDTATVLHRATMKLAGAIDHVLSNTRMHQPFYDRLGLERIASASGPALLSDQTNLNSEVGSCKAIREVTPYLWHTLAHSLPVTKERLRVRCFLP